MRVALFTETYVNSINGVMAHVKTLKYGLEQLGHEVLVVTADKHARHHYIQDGILHCPALESKRFYGFGVALPYSRKRQKMIAEFDPDVIHIHHEFGIGLSGIRAARILNKPLVYTLHTMYDQYIYYIAPKMFLRLATKFSHRYERFIARSATALTSPSLKGDEYFKRIGVNKEFNLIPNSADLEAFNPDKITMEQRQEIRRQYSIPENRRIACFVGRLGKEKSVDVLLDYWAQTITPQDNLHLLIVGDGPDREALEQQAKHLGIQNMVTFTGMISHEKMPAYYACCDIYVTASLSEMNSISMLEGMASGLPTLQRYDELNADQIKNGVNGYLFHTAEEMAERLREIASLSPEELQKRKEMVIETVRNRGSHELATYMLEIYQKAIAEKQKEQNRYRKAV
ncbi:MAG TPA: glycosyltransferase [Clostridiales bacterium]|nr:glycosyltransferase [Clostridiales bacterium]